MLRIFSNVCLPDVYPKGWFRLFAAVWLRLRDFVAMSPYASEDGQSAGLGLSEARNKVHRLLRDAGLEPSQICVDACIEPVGTCIVAARCDGSKDKRLAALQEARAA